MSKFDDIWSDVRIEISNAVKNHPPYASSHEGYAVLLEEVDELWDEIKKKEKNFSRIQDEAIQVAAVAFRLIHDICLDSAN